MTKVKIVGKYIEFNCEVCGRFVRDYASNRNYGRSRYYFCSPRCRVGFCPSGKTKQARDAEYYKENSNEIRDRMKEYYYDNAKDILEKRKQKNRALKSEIISAYGGKCVCCGETMIEFLTIDHIYNDGARHRARVGKGKGVYRDIKKQGFPRGKYQVLCFNCNIAKGFYGYCPHKPEEFNPLDKTPGKISGRIGRPRTVDLLQAG